MLQKFSTIGETRQRFRWEIPEHYNIGHDICDRWAASDPQRLAIIDVAPDGTATEHSFAALRAASNRLANLIIAEGIADSRIAVLLPQSFETAVAHIGIIKTGNVSLPLFTLFGPEALLHRLRDSGAQAIITNADGARTIAAMRDELPTLRLVLSVDGDSDDARSFHDACTEQSDEFTVRQTLADDPAILIYTSGTTGNPKGALHAQRVLLGHLPGVEMSHDFFPQPGDRIWTPADWAWIGGLLDVMMPALHHGVPVVAHRFRKFTAEAAFDLIRTHGIRNAFLPPTALKLMRQMADAEDAGIRMRSVASGGETLGPELITWGQKALGVTINEFYGQTECNMIVSSCAALEPAEPGVMGFAVPGHEVAVIDPTTGQRMGIEAEGEIAVLAPDPVMFLEYFNKPEATADKFVEGPEGRWLKTGDRGVHTTSGRLRFIGRDDDVISSSGYRIGPSEIEDCLITHAAVQMAGVVGKPDPVRGEIVTAFIVLNEGYAASDTLADEIAAHVKAHLAAYEYPRVVRFLDAMPMTTTGKIIRRDLRQMATNEQTP
ncbi:MAG: AMP-dependent synthetase [Alphaproteobacteria bacterium]|mgnify:CR=1 FL=1|nr:AMP-dependent synthetase [Alphaproteobacteria bacterium]MAS46841.1 AMP-dependent synthetase [Alphaproteobacteria bacterium]MAX94936.1 AMP-dependent synthetase [Alphaproteobacteria bacterium]MBN53611.1 AMP-dependent synthetase [Alphaproteobacteria bacterium]OUT41595.1 MAG: AMP-dependent synthetase [Micavibrio sp. TMED2]|tara:strand:- start:26570 stop:28213 length:1644 start_codon:yes stop_codon:yes gene_type:complete